MTKKEVNWTWFWFMQWMIALGFLFGQLYLFVEWRAFYLIVPIAIMTIFPYLISRETNETK